MSTARGSGKPPLNAFSEENEALYDPYVGFEVNNLCADIPWPEWNDAELNAEAWDGGKGGRATTVVAGPRAPFSTTPVFIDPRLPELPPPISYYVTEWKRPQDVFPGAVLTVYDPSNSDFELQLPSEHSSGCNFLKIFIEQLTILQFYAAKYGFPVEMETPSFVANTQGDTWRPWHHIYALCKAGKGQTHKPLHCPYGKYVLRLFYMGSWRKFIVDDRIPCDEQGNCLLPVTQTLGELWPIILSKGLLKILSLTPCTDFSAIDFPLVSAFTGWTHGHFAAENKSNEQVWRRLEILAPQYEQSDTQADGETSQPMKNPNPNPKSLSKKESSKKESRKSPDREELQGERFCILFASLFGISLEEDVSVDCTVAVTMTRDCPLVKVNKREGTKPWKRIRWIYWAKERGLWVDENKLPPFRRLHIITFLPRLSHLLAPDPRLEAVLYDVPIPDNEEEELLEEEAQPFEPEQWCDYLRFLDYLSDVNVFFKPKYFSCNFKVSCLREKMVEGPLTSKGTSKQAVPQNVLMYPTVLKRSCNEPIYLLCESLTGIFLCISLWVCPQAEKLSFGYLEPDQPKIVKVGHGALIVEMFDWRFAYEGEIIGFVKTVGYGSTILNLKPGRHVLRLWLSSDSSYVIDVNSNVNVVLGKSPRLRFMMKNESQQILQYIDSVSNSFIALTSRFGKPDLPAALRDFYETIKPKNDSDKGYYRKLDDFIENFIKCILLTVKDLMPSPEEVLTVMLALRSLFLDPGIRCELPSGTVPSYFQVSSGKKIPPKKTSAVTSEWTSSDMPDWDSVPEDKVVTIQRIFRGFRVRLLWKYQTPARKEQKPFAERLKKVCDLVFAPQNRELEVGRLLRRIVMNQSSLLTTFKFYKDFSNVLQVDEFTGKVPNVEASAWVPITRFVVATHAEGLEPCAFYLSCNLEQAVIQGFDNDTGREIFRKTNATSPHFYQKNRKGYTILVFGWNEAAAKTVNWRLEMVRMKYFPSLHLCNLLMSPTCQPYSVPSLDPVEVRNFYIPNSKSRILRCLIKIQKRTHLTLRLSLSYPYVYFVLVILPDEKYRECTGEDSVVAEVRSSSGVVAVPSLLLEPIENCWSEEGYPDTDATVYIVEAYVLYNSWPLTKQEWGLVEPLRVNGESWKDSTTSVQSKRGGSESRKKLNRASRRSTSEQKIENPFWLLQALTDSSGQDAGDAAVIEEDKSYAESVKAMKLFWEENDPGRRKRGRDMRMKFLYAMSLEEKKNSACYGEDYGEEGFCGDKNEGSNDDPQKIVDRLASFSYLINDPSPTRYVCSPKIFPKMPLKELLQKYARVDKVSSEVEEEESQQSESCPTEMSLGVVMDVVEGLEEERKDFLQFCMYYRAVMANWWEEEQKLSVQLMEEAYETRENLLERMQR